MHIVHVDRQRSWTGQIRRVHFVARLLHQSGDRVTVIAHPGSELARRCRADGITVIELPLRGSALYVSILRAAWRLRGHAVDAIHCHGGRDQVLAFAVARLLGIPHVLRTKHNHTPPRGRRSVRAYEACDHIDTVSEYVRQILVDAGVSPGKVEAIPDAVDLDAFVPRPRDPALMRELGLDPDDVVIGNLSSLHVRKGIEDVLRAYARLRQGRFGARLKCLLAGKQCDQWRPLVRELGIEDGVVFPGFREDVPAIVSLFDVFVLMSRREALGTSVLEALAMERPVVAANVGGLVESVTEETGVRCEPGDIDGVVAAVEGLLADPERARRLAKAGRQRVVAVYSDRMLADRSLAIYERVVRKRAAPA